jgi:ribosome biogenesis GTPase / thiamine phosphate phosphatase
MIGVVLEGVGGVYRVHLGDGEEVEAYLRGRIKREVRTGERVVAGDQVTVARTKGGEGWTIEEVEPRRTELVRAGMRGRRPKLVAANVDQVLVVIAAAQPSFNPEIADRFLVLSEGSGIAPVLVINKMDLLEGQSGAGGKDPWDLYREIGYPVVACSALSGAGLAELHQLMQGKVSVLAGPSGVGKSSLLNALHPELDLRTQPVSSRKGRGRHTTVSARLLILDRNVRVIDTPGFSEVKSWQLSAQELGECFPEIRERAWECRFRGCSHQHEPGCRIMEAVEAGDMAESRYESYLKLLEAQDTQPR